ncbi:hypothetical protein H2248_003997 [Termitomyces sp. 'cryptogamus']|nr:hypothetical protein H2248_003997 [Termitomyces sp. 'cryptogamus']
MSSTSDFKQLPHKLLAIPGPIEVSDEVLFANATPVVSHVSPDFVKILGDAIRPTRGAIHETSAAVLNKWQRDAGMGSGKFYELNASPFQPRPKGCSQPRGARRKCAGIAYWIFRPERCSLQTYGAEVDVLKAKLGTAAKQAAVEEALKQKKYKIVTFTHVDTSTFQWVFCRMPNLSRKPSSGYLQKLL